MKFTPAASILTTASPGFGEGSGRSSSCSTSGPPFLWTRTAFILLSPGTRDSLDFEGGLRENRIVAPVVARVEGAVLHTDRRHPPGSLGGEPGHENPAGPRSVGVVRVAGAGEVDPRGT